MNSIKHNSQYVEFKNYVSIIIGIIISHLMFVNIHDYIEKHNKEWFDNNWEGTGVTFFRLIASAITYVLVEYQLDKLWAFK